MRERGAKDEAAHSRYRAETEQRLRELDERTKQKRGAGMERLGVARSVGRWRALLCVHATDGRRARSSVGGAGNKRLSLNRTELQSSNRKMDVGKFIMDGPFQRRCVSELDWCSPPQCRMRPRTSAHPTTHAWGAALRRK